MPESADRDPTRVAPAWLLGGLALYLALMAVQASLLAPSGRSDDLETLLLAQSLEWGYEAKNPPAFYWVAHVATELAGPTLPTIYALRFLGVFLMYAGLYAIARRLQPDPLLAACAGFAMLATLHFHWYLFYFLTNTAFAMALGPAAILALLRIRDRPAPASYALFGLAIGLGLLCRYNYAIFAAGLLAAALSLPEWRARLLDRRGLIAAGVVLLLLAPHVAWVARHFGPLAAAVGAQLEGVPTPYHLDVAEGLANLAEATVSILAFPLGLLCLLCFPRAFRPVRVADPHRASAIALVGRTVPACLALVAVFVLTGSPYVKPHHLFFLALAPLWLIARLDRATLRPRAPRVFAGGLVACCALAVVAYPIENRRDAADCGACEEFQPVARYAEAVRAAGFAGGTIVALSRRQAFPTAALRVAFPEARMVATDYPLYAPEPDPAPPGDCLLVWSGASEWPESWPGAPHGPAPGVGLPLPPHTRFGKIEAAVHLSGRPAHGMRFALVPGGLGDCR
jgi:4-amino-4-deoxy-L-arabinose transferase-like glycosyltransferase